MNVNLPFLKKIAGHENYSTIKPQGITLEWCMLEPLAVNDLPRIEDAVGIERGLDALNLNIC